MISLQEARIQGLKRYFTGQPCSKGHVAERSVASRCCCKCSRARTASWKKASRPHLRAYEKDYFRKNAERFSERNKGYRAKDPEKTKTARQKEYQRNKKRYQAWSKEYREANIDRLKDYYRARVAANPEQYRTYKRNYKARKRSAAGSHTQPDVREIFFAQRGKCGYCRVKLGKGYHVDHITALANGGSNDRKNLQILCGPCNNSKSAKDPIDFARSRGMLI